MDGGEDAAAGHVIASNVRDSSLPQRMHGELLAVSMTGAPRWQLSLDDEIDFGGTVYSGPWVSRGLQGLSIGDASYAVWTLVHYT